MLGLVLPHQVCYLGVVVSTGENPGVEGLVLGRVHVCANCSYTPSFISNHIFVIFATLNALLLILLPLTR